MNSMMNYNPEARHPKKNSMSEGFFRPFHRSTVLRSKCFANSRGNGIRADSKNLRKRQECPVQWEKALWRFLTLSVVACFGNFSQNWIPGKFQALHGWNVSKHNYNIDIGSEGSVHGMIKIGGIDWTAFFYKETPFEVKRSRNLIIRL